MKNHKHVLSRLSPLQRTQLQRNNSPNSLPIVHAVSNDERIVLQRRANSSTNDAMFLSQLNMLKHTCTKLSTEALVGWKNRSQYFNQRDHHVDAPMDDDTLQICQSERKLKMLTISWLKLDKAFCLKLQRSNRDSNQNESGELRDKHASLPHEMQLKRHFF